MFRAIIGHSSDPESVAAAAEVVAACRRELAGDTATAGLLFAGVDHDHLALLAAICDAFPGLPLIGCTTDGELSSRTGFSEGAVVLTLLTGVPAAVGLGRDINHDPAGAVQRAVAAASAALGGPPALCCITPDGLTLPATPLLAALRAALPPGTPIVGGTAADEWRFVRTLQFCGREVVHDAVPLLLLGGGLQVTHAFASGWQGVGAVEAVTAARNYSVQRIGERTALEFYRHYLGDHILPSGEHPLTVQDPDGGVYLRAPQAYDLATGSVRFAAEIAVGSRVQLSSATRGDILAASRAAVVAAQGEFHGAPELALVFSCAARKQQLGTRTGEECASALEVLGDVAVAGFYGYGEFIPLGRGRTCTYHNETFVIVLLGAGG